MNLQAKYASPLLCLQPHEDGSLEPLSDLAVAPSFFSTWPFRIAMRLARSAFSHLPPSVQSSLPVSLRAHQQPIESESNTAEGFDVSPTNGSTSRSKQKPRSQGTDTPNTATSLSDSEEGDENDETPNGSGTEAKPKKKRGPGKAAGMRRRKMGMKK
ncbi:hypothetical protein BD324DRAFT_308965 [Kockovaella imperatae]|uniref:Uncharacterized protein n=1 Tax=Kockovaella imperatae TaxID=4999 RepID=A0A1Y1ULZ6_9TREE|nr:hypothetical protein BD324DRAFT_308965 [Kockovaella imperatae]ORX39071.1 hypothetical protein BD324DRAFT_308965 [Kockovaella imperatae]